MSLALTIGAEYNVNFYAPSILGTGLRRAKLRAILDYETVRSLADVANTHAAVYSLLPSGVPRSPNQLTYYKFSTTSGETTIVAAEWISGNPELATTSTLNVTFDNVATGDISRLRALLTSNGFAFTINS